MANTIHVDIVSAERELFSGEATMVFAPAVQGEVGIAPRHTPMLTPLNAGDVRVRTADGEEEIIYVSGGMLEVQRMQHRIRRIEQFIVVGAYRNYDVPRRVPARVHRVDSGHDLRTGGDMINFLCNGSINVIVISRNRVRERPSPEFNCIHGSSFICIGFCLLLCL